MEKDQLISVIQFLVKREEEGERETQELKEMLKELRDTHKADMTIQVNLMESIDSLTKQLSDLSAQNTALQQEVDNLLSQISKI